MSIFGTAIIAANGRELQSVEGSASLKPGLSTSKPRKGPRGYVGGSVVPGMSEVKCDVIPTDDFDPEDFANGLEVTIRFFCEQSGQEWVIAKASLSDDVELGDGEDASWSGLIFTGTKAEKV